jgi:hypothetical protein
MKKKLELMDLCKLLIKDTTVRNVAGVTVTIDDWEITIQRLSLPEVTPLTPSKRKGRNETH